MDQTMGTAPTAWVEVDTAAIRHNYAEVRRLVGPNVAVMAVI
jgi:alanine racemase